MSSDGPKQGMRGTGMKSATVRHRKRGRINRTTGSGRDMGVSWSGDHAGDLQGSGGREIRKMWGFPGSGLAYRDRERERSYIVGQDRPKQGICDTGTKSVTVRHRKCGRINRTTRDGRDIGLSELRSGWQ